MARIQYEDTKTTVWLLAFFGAIATGIAVVFSDTKLAGMLAWERGHDCVDVNRSPFASQAQYEWQLVMMLAVIGIAMCANVWIVHNHWTTPPHPKFVMLPIRRFGVRLHLLSGTVEIVLGVVSWFVSTPGVVRAMAIASCLHCFSAFLITPVAAGIKAITNPGYIFCIVFKAVQAINVIYNPDCYLRVISLVLTHTIYAWFRISYAICIVFNLMEAHAYTVALIISLVLVISMLGTWISLCFFTTVFLYNLILPLYWHKAYVLWHRKEAPRTFHILQIGCPFLKQKHNPATLALHAEKTLARVAPKGEKVPELTQARIVFDSIDTNGDGVLSVVELAWTLRTGGVPLSDVEQIMAMDDKDHSGDITFDEFVLPFRPLWLWAYSDMQNAKLAAEELAAAEELEVAFYEHAEDKFHKKGKQARAEKHAKGKKRALE